MRRLGLDFDNTIVCYDEVFHHAALAGGLIPPTVVRNKNAVRDHLRAHGREAAWVALQGEVYGPRLSQAEPFPGLLEFLHAAPEAGWEVCIVSHKTRHPFAGPRWDLHQAARDWIGRTLEGLVSPANIHLELTKDDKLHRIAELGCAHFIDDLPEILLAPAFPSGTKAWLFDPAAHFDTNPRYQRVAHWSELRAALLHDEVTTP